MSSESSDYSSDSGSGSSQSQGSASDKENPRESGSINKGKSKETPHFDPHSTKNTHNAVCVYDFTLFLEVRGNEMPVKREELVILLCSVAKKWAFQLEKTSEGKLHYQGRFSLKVKERMASLLQDGGVFSKYFWIHLSPTSEANRENMFYVMKPDSRVDGPWTDKDETVIELPTWFVEHPLRPWQQKVFDSKNVTAFREVNVIFDPKGGIGKSWFTTFLALKQIGNRVPPLNNFQDLMRIVMQLKDRPIYIFDMPRALAKKSFNDFYAALEEIKNGHCWDDRYKYQEKYLKFLPSVWVFTNTMPDKEWMSAGRWKLWVVDYATFDLKAEEFV